MMRFKSVLTGVFVVFLFCTSVNAFQNEPDGFRGHKWGDSFQSFMGGMTWQGKDVYRIEYYQKIGEKLSIGRASLVAIYYAFFNNQLSGVVILFEGKENHQALKDAVFNQYGDGAKGDTYDDEELYTWNSDKVSISYHYDQTTLQGKLSYFYNELNQRARKERMERSKKGAHDF